MPETFIDAYIEHTRIYESPLCFWKWSAYFSIATALRDKCMLQAAGRKIYPNLYILFLAESSGWRKNGPIELSQTLVSLNRNITAISGRASVQGILDVLASAETDAKTAKVNKTRAVSFYAPELSAGIVNDVEGMKILTDIYDFKTNPYKSMLRTGPKFDLQGIVYSMLMGSNSEMLTGVFDQAVIRGGFMARTLLVVPKQHEFRKGNTLLREDEQAIQKSEKNVAALLSNIYQLSGVFKFEPDAIDEYEAWYIPFRDDYMVQKEATGIVGRIQTHVLKIAQVFAANEMTMCIQKRHIERAIEECIGLLPNYRAFVMNNTRTPIGNVSGIVLTNLLDAPNYMMNRKELLRSNWQNFDSEQLEKAITTLSEAGYIKTHALRNGEIAYQLTDEFVNRMKK